MERRIRQDGADGRGRLREKLPLLEQALVGKVTQHHQFILQQLLRNGEGDDPVTPFLHQIERWQSQFHASLGAPRAHEGLVRNAG